jgi:hypothetical protein
VLESRREEIVNSVIAALLSTLSRDYAAKRIEAFGISHETAVAFVSHIERDTEFRSDLARRFMKRAWVAGFGCLAAAALAFSHVLHGTYLGIIAVCAVYCGQAIVGWVRYSKTIER